MNCELDQLMMELILWIKRRESNIQRQKMKVSWVMFPASLQWADRLTKRLAVEDRGEVAALIEYWKPPPNRATNL